MRYKKTLVQPEANYPIMAGLTCNGVEIFAKEKALKAAYQGKIVCFADLPEHKKAILRNQMLKTEGAFKALTQWGFNELDKATEQFAICNYGGLDKQADIAEGKLAPAEYWNCGNRGRCKFEGVICKPRFTLTPTELEAVIAIAKFNHTNQVIAENLGFSSSRLDHLLQAIKEKLNVQTREDIAKWAIKNNIN